jgi:hypothetical protein
MEESGSSHSRATLSRGKGAWYPLNRSLGGSQPGVGAFGGEGKLLPLPGSVLRRNTYMNYNISMVLV